MTRFDRPTCTRAPGLLSIASVLLTAAFARAQPELCENPKLGAWGEALDALDRAAARFAPNRETWAALAGISQDRAKGHDFLHDALRLLMRRDRAVGAKAYEAWLLAAARANDVDRVDALARARADGRLRIVVGERGARRRALDDGVRLDTDGRLDELEAAVLRSRRTSPSSAVPAKR